MYPCFMWITYLTAIDMKICWWLDRWLGLNTASNGDFYEHFDLTASRKFLNREREEKIDKINRVIIGWFLSSILYLVDGHIMDRRHRFETSGFNSQEKKSRFFFRSLHFTSKAKLLFFFAAASQVFNWVIRCANKKINRYSHKHKEHNDL